MRSLFYFDCQVIQQGAAKPREAHATSANADLWHLYHELRDSMPCPVHLAKVAGHATATALELQLISLEQPTGNVMADAWAREGAHDAQISDSGIERIDSADELAKRVVELGPLYDAVIARLNQTPTD